MRIVLFQPDIAGNLGAAMRICACFDLPLEIIEPCGFPLTSKALRRTAMDYGAPDTLIRHTSWHTFAETITGRLVLMTTRGSRPLTQHRFKSDDVIIFGRESSGVPEHVRARADAAIKIPMPGEATRDSRSLNLATSVAICVFEAHRQVNSLD